MGGALLASRPTPRIRREAPRQVGPGQPNKPVGGAAAATREGGVLNRVAEVKALEGQLLDTIAITPSDLAVQPVLSAKARNLKYDTRSLGFAPFKPKEWLERPGTEVEAHMGAIATALNLSLENPGRRGAAGASRVASAQSRSKNHVLAYVYTCITHSDHIANMIVNSALFLSLAAGFKIVPEYARER